MGNAGRQYKASVLNLVSDGKPQEVFFLSDGGHYQSCAL